MHARTHEYFKIQLSFKWTKLNYYFLLLVQRKRRQKKQQINHPYNFIILFACDAANDSYLMYK